MKRKLRSYLKSSYGVDNFQVTKVVETGVVTICQQSPVITRLRVRRDTNGLIGISRSREALINTWKRVCPSEDMDLLEIERYGNYYICY